MKFVETDPTLSNYWRSVILFGRNVASYKFALGKSLLELSARGSDLITLEELSPFYARHICNHLALEDKQATSASSTFLEACRSFNRGDLSEAQLIDTTTKMGFKNVIDAFHVVNQSDIPRRFFLDERKQNNGIRLTENFFELFEEHNASNLLNETEARWRLVETAWSMGLSAKLISFEQSSAQLYTTRRHSRVAITSSRDALNGYQKGRCFYSFKPISINANSPDLADVDHFFPHVLKTEGVIPNLDGVWNLVLSSQECNRGVAGKFAKVPSLRLLQRLHTRNEYLISSHHPLRETLIAQTGSTEPARKSFLQSCYDHARSILIHTWEPSAEDDDSF